MFQKYLKVTLHNQYIKNDLPWQLLRKPLKKKLQM